MGPDRGHHLDGCPPGRALAAHEALEDLRAVAGDLLDRVREDRDRLGTERWLWRLTVLTVGATAAAGAIMAEQVLRPLARRRET